jgi:transcriptional regulator with AAA-type ATPase domain
LDYKDVAGNDLAKRALQIAAAGKHGLLMMGPPGSGKTMLASRMPSILPPLNEEEMLKTALDSYKTRLRNQIEENEKAIADVESGKPYEKRGKRKLDLDDEAQALKARNDELKKRLDEAQGTAMPASTMPAPTTQLAPVSSLSPITQQPTALEDAMAEEYIEPEHEPENLNLSALGKTMLEKALERNNGNRRKAAQELGISDRTLYRRLKQYGLDEG